MCPLPPLWGTPTFPPLLPIPRDEPEGLAGLRGCGRAGVASFWGGGVVQQSLTRWWQATIWGCAELSGLPQGDGAVPPRTTPPRASPPPRGMGIKAGGWWWWGGVDMAGPGRGVPGRAGGGRTGGPIKARCHQQPWEQRRGCGRRCRCVGWGLRCWRRGAACPGSACPTAVSRAGGTCWRGGVCGACGGACPHRGVLGFPPRGSGGGSGSLSCGRCAQSGGLCWFYFYFGGHLALEGRFGVGVAARHSPVPHAGRVWGVSPEEEEEGGEPGDGAGGCAAGLRARPTASRG